MKRIRIRGNSNMEQFFWQVIQIAIPFAVFATVAGFMIRKSNGKDENDSVAEIRNEEKINSLFHRYFALTDEPMTFSYDEAGRTHQIRMEAAKEPVMTVDDVNVSLDGLKLNSFRNYVYYKQRFSGKVLLEIRDICQNEKRTEAFLEKIDAENRKAANSHTLILKQTIETIREAEETIKDIEVSDSLADLRENMVKLKDYDRRFGSEHRDVERLCNQYMKILKGILGQFEKLEDSANPAEFEKVKAKLLAILSQLCGVVDKITGSLDEDEFIDIETELSSLSSKIELDQKSSLQR
jgi:hypothetical protein